MEINPIQSTMFTGTKVPKKIRKDKLSTILSVNRLVENTKLYKEADLKNFDLYFLKPTRKNEIMRVIYYDKKMETFVRNEEGKLLETSATSIHKPNPSTYIKLADRISSTLYDVVHGRFKAPYWYYDPNKYAEEYANICKRNYIKP